MKTNDHLENDIFVIFGGAGDLTWRKLMPALFDLSQSHGIPARDKLKPDEDRNMRIVPKLGSLAR
jgi:glucose-6-phosphate 1-dehydrogenase